MSIAPIAATEAIRRQDAAFKRRAVQRMREAQDRCGLRVEHYDGRTAELVRN